MAYLSHNLKVGFYKLYFLNFNATQVEFLSQTLWIKFFRTKNIKIQSFQHQRMVYFIKFLLLRNFFQQWKIQKNVLAVGNRPSRFAYQQLICVEGRLSKCMLQL